MTTETPTLWFAAMSLFASGSAQTQEPTVPPPPANYAVHEWGTFTSMADSHGIVLEGLQREEEGLPKFVHDLLTVQETGTTDSKLPASYVTQKMETPVIYFHADAPLHVQVDVRFEQGLMTQFYPLPTTIYPLLDEARGQRIDMRKVDESSLHWDIDVVPRSQPAPSEIPQVANDDPWSFARMTDSCWVRTRPASGSPAKPEAEHYLFYRGLGRWQPKVDVVAERGGHLHFTNSDADTIPFCMAFELGEHGGRFVTGQPCAAGATQAFELGSGAWQTDREQFARRVGAVVMQALVRLDLNLDEARAMVATWSRSWFQKDGTRVLYVLPRTVVDQVLPLWLDPRPKQLVRVLVGRYECITPEAQDRVERALVDRDAIVLASLDRFLEPQLRNVVRNGSTPAARSAAQAKLAELTR